MLAAQHAGDALAEAVREGTLFERQQAVSDHMPHHVGFPNWGPWWQRRSPRSPHPSVLGSTGLHLPLPAAIMHLSMLST